MLHAKKALPYIHFLFLQPGKQLLETCWGVSELVMSKLIGVILMTEGDIQGNLGDINTDKPY